MDILGDQVGVRKPYCTTLQEAFKKIDIDT